MRTRLGMVDLPEVATDRLRPATPWQGGSRKSELGLLGSWRGSRRAMGVTAIGAAVWGIVQTVAAFSGAAFSWGLTGQPFIGAAAVVDGVMQVAIVCLMYAAVRVGLKRRLAAPWLAYVVLGYMGAAMVVRAAAATVWFHAGIGQGLGLLAAALGVMGACVGYQQLNVSLSPWWRCGTLAELALRALPLGLVVQSLLELASLWYSVTSARLVRGMVSAAYAGHSVAGLFAALCLLVALWCVDVGVPFPNKRIRSSR